MAFLIYVLLITAAWWLIARAMRHRQDGQLFTAFDDKVKQQIPPIPQADSSTLVDQSSDRGSLSWMRKKKEDTTATPHLPRSFFIYKRCDRCPATARYVAFKEGTSLDFCKHHTKKYQDKLSQQGFVIIPDDEMELVS